jgi:cytochrome c
MPVSFRYLIASFIAIACSSPALASEDVGVGHEIYQTQCSPCHSNQPGVNGIGPSLAGLAGRQAGSLPGFHFTPALQGSGLTWNADTFIQFLGDRAGNGDDRHGARRDSTRQSLCLSCHA